MKTRTFFATIAAMACPALITAVPEQSRADAIVMLSGSDANAGSIDLSTAGTSAFGGEITAGGVTGYSVWGLLGGNASGAGTSSTNTSGTTITYGGITIFTPTGDNSKNAALHDYLVVTTASGTQSVVSLGEIDPFFVGAAASNNILVSVTGSTASLSFLGAGAAARDLSNITNIQLLSVPALPGPPPTVSNTNPIQLSGNVHNPGSYTAAQLAGDFPSPSASFPAETVAGDTYYGVSFFSFLDPSASSLNAILDQYVVVAGSDGYEAVFSLAELDPSLDNNAGDFLAYGDTGTNFPSDGIARIVIPGDASFHEGRWVSNIDYVDVATPVPEPSSISIVLLLTGLAGLATRRSRIPT
jgi:hypothetical protein